MEAYLDNSATTKCSRRAIELMVQLFAEDYGNPSSLHTMGSKAEAYIKEAGKKIAKTLKVSEKEIVFTSGGTEANNLAILGSVGANKRAGTHVITSAVEHASVQQPAEQLQKLGYKVTYLPVDAEGVILLEALEDALDEETVLVSLMQANNEIGTIEPIKEAAERIRRLAPKALIHVDAIQSYGKMIIRPKELDIDLLSVSGHKIHGPKGSGFLYIKDKTKINPLLFGGGQQKGLRSGTENVPAIAGLGEAAAEIYENLEEKAGHMYELREYFIREVTKIPGVTVNGRSGTGSAPHIVSVSVEGVRSEVLLHSLEERGIYISAGSACSSNHKKSVSRTLLAIGLKQNLLESTVRFSFCDKTTKEEIAYALECMNEIIPFRRKFTRK
ncbi:MAG: cysteine desulfurase [Lachnospiraceae bacterium]|nr:cysteine desulfurase [Lachnospiraceae bacterium]